VHVFRRPELSAALSLPRVVPRQTGGAPAAWVIAMAILAPGILRGQGATDGGLHGVALDAAWRPAPGVIVALKSVDGPEERSAQTGADGTFLLAHLPPGSYALAIGAPGEVVQVAAPVAIPLGETVEVRATLLIAGSAVQVQLLDQPSSPVPFLPDENGDGLTTARGLEPMQNETFLDGVSANQAIGSVPVGTGASPGPDPDGDSDSAEVTTGPANGMSRGRHAGVAYVFSQAAVREFRVSGQGYSAQTGRAGDVATTVSRSGTNDWHGSGSFAVRSQVLAASDPLAIATSYANGVVTTGEVKPHDLRENFGVALGGPVSRRGLTFFYAFDQQLRGFPAMSSPADGSFYQLTAIQTTLLENRGVTAAALNSALNYVSSLTGLTPRRADEQINFVRMDWHLPHHVGVAGEYNWVRWTSPAGLIDAPVVARGRASIGSAAGSLDSVVLRLTARFKERTGNELRFGYVRDVQYETPQVPLAQEPAISSGGLAPEVNISPNGLLFGTPATLSQIAYPDERRVQVADTLTLMRGRHLVEIGGEFSVVNDRVATLANAAGTFRYDSGATGGKAGGLVDFITDYTFNVNAYPNGGCPAITAAAHLFCFRSFSQSFGETSVAFPTWEFAGFVEDTWRPARRLTIHAGLRYEYTLLPIPYTPNPSLDALFGSRGATSVFPEDRNNLGPRAAISYEPLGAGHGVVRAGFGLFFGRVPGATIQAALSDTAQSGSTTRVRIRPSNETACPQAPAQGFGYPCAFGAQPPGVVAATTSAVVFDRRFRLPVVEQGSFALEHAIARKTTLTTTYVLNLDRQLSSSTDLNIVPSTTAGTFQLQGGTGAPGVRDGEIFQLPVYTSRVSPSFGPVTDVVSDVNASYNGLTVVVESRPRSSLTVRAEYAWSKAIDFGQAQSATPRTDGQFDPFSNGYDKGLSSLNYPWGLRVAAVWTPRVREASRWVRRLGDGWELTPIVAEHSGRPYSFDLSGGTYLAGGHESLNGSGGALYLPTVGRNTLRLPAVEKVDLKIERRFRAGRERWVMASVEGFNLLNHENVSSVNQRAYLVGTPVAGITPLLFQSAAEIALEGLNTTAFGTPTAAGTSLARARQVQLEVRFEF